MSQHNYCLMHCNVPSLVQMSRRWICSNIYLLYNGLCCTKCDKDEHEMDVSHHNYCLLFNALCCTKYDKDEQEMDLFQHNFCLMYCAVPSVVQMSRRWMCPNIVSV